MKKLFIPKIHIDTMSFEEIQNKLSSLSSNNIDIINWEDFPFKPDVQFKIAHNGENILLQYVVHESEILGLVNEDNGKVWTDSCVEFFISFDNNKSYYNTEANCIGKVLQNYRTVQEKIKRQSAEVMSSIQRFPSLGNLLIERSVGDFEWSLTLIIPASAYWLSNITSFDGVKARANFYKCGDNLNTPHYVSWNKIDSPTPNFHQPLFFGEIEFGKEVSAD